MSVHFLRIDAIHTASRVYHGAVCITASRVCRQKRSGRHGCCACGSWTMMISNNCLCKIYGTTSP